MNIHFDSRVSQHKSLLFLPFPPKSTFYPLKQKELDIARAMLSFSCFIIVEHLMIMIMIMTIMMIMWPLCRDDDHRGDPVPHPAPHPETLCQVHQHWRHRGKTHQEYSGDIKTVKLWAGVGNLSNTVPVEGILLDNICTRNIIQSFSGII